MRAVAFFACLCDARGGLDLQVCAFEELAGTRASQGAHLHADLTDNKAASQEDRCYSILRPCMAHDAGEWYEAAAALHHA